MRISRLVLCAALGFGTAAGAGGAKKPAPTKPAPKKAVVMVSGEHKKALVEMLGGFKFGMTKDEVLAVMQKKIDENYEERIKQTTDVAAQDRLRRDKKSELGRVSGTYVSFDTDVKTGWDVSIVDGEFAHKTGEALMERWENQGGKNQRRFFFFFDGKLWKMFVSLDVSVLPEDKKNFDTLKAYMESKYGAGTVEPGMIEWNAGEFHARAVDRLKDYDAIGIALEDSKMRSEVEARRAANAPPPKEGSPVLRSVMDPDHKDHPGIKDNDGAVDAVIKAQGGK